MGVVWLAERTDGLINRPVALKLPHGAWKRAGLAERMARERDILATLTHPNIARLYDAGLTAAGSPFSPSSTSKGSRSTCTAASSSSICRRGCGCSRRWPTRSPTRTRKLVVHRDLKPANILVTRRRPGAPARLRHRQAARRRRRRRRPALTELSGRALTPDYASPEQIRRRAAHHRVGRLFARRGALRAAQRAAAVQAEARLARRTRRRDPAGRPAAAERRCRSQCAATRCAAISTRSCSRRSRRSRRSGTRRSTPCSTTSSAISARGRCSRSPTAAGTASASSSHATRSRSAPPPPSLVALLVGASRRRLAGAGRARGEDARGGSAGLHRVGVPRGRPDDQREGKVAVGGGFAAAGRAPHARSRRCDPAHRGGAARHHRRKPVRPAGERRCGARGRTRPASAGVGGRSQTTSSTLDCI